MQRPGPRAARCEGGGARPTRPPRLATSLCQRPTSHSKDRSFGKARRHLPRARFPRMNSSRVEKRSIGAETAD
jgi:hypothetical protein